MKKINKKVLIEVELVFRKKEKGGFLFDWDDNIDRLNDVGKYFKTEDIKNLKVEEER